jgi:hypothetical protein
MQHGLSLGRIGKMDHKSGGGEIVLVLNDRLLLKLAGRDCCGDQA